MQQIFGTIRKKLEDSMSTHRKINTNFCSSFSLLIYRSSSAYVTISSLHDTFHIEKHFHGSKAIHINLTFNNRKKTNC